MIETASASAIAKMFDRARFSKVADGLAVAVAISIPWSTTATSVLVIVWLLALLPTLKPADLAQEFRNPASGLTVVFWTLAIVGMLWSEARFAEQLYSIKGFHKLLVLPLLFIQFRRSDKGAWVLGGFLISCTVLLAVSWTLYYSRVPPWRTGVMGVPHKDYIFQSAEFLICAFALAHLAIDAWRKNRPVASLALATLAALFLANVAFVATSRTSVAAFPVLVLLFGVQRFGWKAMLGVAIGGGALIALIWTSSPYLRLRTLSVADEIQRYQSGAETSAGYRLEFWKKSIAFVAEAPVLGHGTGSIPTLFRRAAVGDTGITAAVTGNPHNQTLEIAAQFGLIGVGLLYAMWIAHLVMLRGGGVPAWLGQGLVAQTIVGALFLSYLLDFSTGWLYVFGVGVLGGMADRARVAEAARRSQDGA
jgi:O-antigen ligase